MRGSLAFMRRGFGEMRHLRTVPRSTTAEPPATHASTFAIAKVLAAADQPLRLRAPLPGTAVILISLEQAPFLRLLYETIPFA